MSRIGVWSYDMVNSQLFQQTVAPREIASASSAEMALCRWGLRPGGSPVQALRGVVSCPGACAAPALELPAPQRLCPSPGCFASTEAPLGKGFPLPSRRECAPDPAAPAADPCPDLPLWPGCHAASRSC